MVAEKRDPSRRGYSSAINGLHMIDHVELLRRYNEWRRGGEGAHPNPVDIGKAIDAAIASMERLRLIESAARNLTKVKGRYNSQMAYERLVDALQEKRPPV